MNASEGNTEKLQVAAEVVTALWPIFAATGAFFMAGVIRVERLAWRLRQNDKDKEEMDRKLYALRVEVSAIDTKILAELTRIGEAVAYIKGTIARDRE